MTKANRPVDKAIQSLYRIQNELEEVLIHMEESYSQGLVLGDDGNLELLVSVENNVTLLRGRLQKIAEKRNVFT